MFLLLSDDKIFDCVSFLTFGVSTIRSVVFVLLKSHVSRKVQILSCFWLLALFYSGLHCKIQNKTEYFGNYIHLHTHTYTHTLVLLPQHFVTSLDIESVSCCVGFCIRDY